MCVHVACTMGFNYVSLLKAGIAVMVVTMVAAHTCNVREYHADCRDRNYLHIPRDLSRDITWLDMRRNNIQEISVHDFRPYSQLTRLCLGFNKIKIIPAGVFEGLSRLTHLYLDANPLDFCVEYMNPDSFWGLTSLQVLTLRAQFGIVLNYTCTEYPYGVLGDVTNVTYLAVQVQNAVTSAGLGQEIVEHLPLLESLVMNRCRHLDNLFAFIRKSSIKNLIFTYPYLLNTSKHIFKDFPSLETLVFMKSRDIQFNELMEKLSDLGEINLTGLSLDLLNLGISDVNLKGEIFCRDLFSNLKKISLFNINTRDFEPELLQCLSNAEEITLKYLNPRFFGKFFIPRLESLLLGFKSLKAVSIDRVFYSNSDFTIFLFEYGSFELSSYVISIDHYFAPVFPKYAQGIHDDSELDSMTTMSGSAVQQGGFGISLPPALKQIQFTNVDSICLVDDYTESIRIYPNEVEIVDFHDSSVLCKAGWMETDASISGVGFAKYVDFSNNGLSSLPRIDDHKLQVRILNVSHNQLGSLEIRGWKIEKEFIWKCAELIFLDLSYNRIKSLPHTLSKTFVQLKTLILNNNQITSLMFLTYGLKSKIHLVDIAENNMAILETDFIHETIHLGKSNLSIYLQGNPFICICSFKDTIVWISTTRMNLIGRHSYQCSENESLYVTQIDIDQLCQTSASSTIITSFSVIGGIIVTVVTAFILYKNRIRIRISWYLYRRNVRSKYWVTNIDLSSSIYVIYNDDCHDDRSFVNNILQPKMEGEFKQKLFIWERDGPVGGSHGENIVDKMASCSKIIIILSKNLFQINTGIEDSDNPPSQANRKNVTENEWMTFILLTATRFLFRKKICVIKRGVVHDSDTRRQFRPLLFPDRNVTALTHPVTLIDTSSSRFDRDLEAFTYLGVAKD